MYGHDCWLSIQRMINSCHPHHSYCLRDFFFHIFGFTISALYLMEWSEWQGDTEIIETQLSDWGSTSTFSDCSKLIRSGDFLPAPLQLSANFLSSICFHFSTLLVMLTLLLMSSLLLFLLLAHCSNFNTNRRIKIN